VHYQLDAHTAAGRLLTSGAYAVRVSARESTRRTDPAIRACALRALLAVAVNGDDGLAQGCGSCLRWAAGHVVVHLRPSVLC